MNAKRRTLAVLAAVIAVLGLALWALNRSTAAEEAASSAAADGTIPLCSFSTADLSRITYTYNGQTLTLDDADGSWTLAEDPDYHLDESACNTMVTALSSLHAKRQLDAQAGEDYGFDAPELTVTVTAADHHPDLWQQQHRHRRPLCAEGRRHRPVYRGRQPDGLLCLR